MHTIHILRSTWKDGKYEKYWDFFASFQEEKYARVALYKFRESWPSADFQLTSADKPSK